jgi:hypothetical protein
MMKDKKSYRNIDRGTTKYLPFPLASITTILCIVSVLSTLSAFYVSVRRQQSASTIRKDVTVTPTKEVGVSMTHISTNERSENTHANDDRMPSIRALHDLTSAELHPKAGPDRHIVDPPQDILPVTLVTCTTTVGYLHVSGSLSNTVTVE